MIGYTHRVTISQSQAFKQEWSSILNSEPDIIRLLNKNFFTPIANGWCPFSELEGKYKPSFDVPFIKSVMRDAFIAQAKNHNLYHYHFGYPVYLDGFDKKYEGKVSDGIIHTKVIVDDVNKSVEHRIIQICKTHPNPFTIPFDRLCN